jgi:hypothetical protein
MISKGLNVKVLTDYFIVAAMLAVNAFPYLCSAQTNFFILFFFVSFIFLKRSIPFNTSALTIIFAFALVESLQLAFIKPFDPIMISGTAVRLLLAFFTVSLLRNKYIEYYIDVVCFFAFISFFFFIPSLLVPGFFKFFVSNVCPFFDPPFVDKGGFYFIWPTNILYCFHDCVLGEFRNPGPFWEPGLFAVFLNLALLFNFIKEKKIWNFKNIVLIAALISTFSTAGYIGFFVLVFSFYIINVSLIKKILLTIVALPIMLMVYFSAEFLSSKVEQNIELANTTTSSRFGSALADFNDFVNSPLIGWGRGVMRYGGKHYAFFSEEQHRNNSVTDLLATYGIFLFIFYFVNYYYSLKKYCVYCAFNPKFAIWGLLVILILGFSQTIFLRPFFYSLLFIHYVYNENETALKNEITGNH